MVNLDSIPFAALPLTEIVPGDALLHPSTLQSRKVSDSAPNTQEPSSLSLLHMLNTNLPHWDKCSFAYRQQTATHSYSNVSKNPEERIRHRSFVLDSCSILLYCLSMFLSTAIQKSLQLSQTVKILRYYHNGNTSRNGFIIFSMLCGSGFYST